LRQVISGKTGMSAKNHNLDPTGKGETLDLMLQRVERDHAGPREKRKPALGPKKKNLKRVSTIWPLRGKKNRHRLSEKLYWKQEGVQRIPVRRVAWAKKKTRPRPKVRARKKGGPTTSKKLPHFLEEKRKKESGLFLHPQQGKKRTLRVRNQNYVEGEAFHGLTERKELKTSRREESKQSYPGREN